MTTKHTPATPLPYWMAKTLVGDVVKYAIGSGDKEIGVYDRREDALFAYYAANAYPRLVEALHNAKDMLSNVASVERRAATARQCSVLLRDLGEGQ